MLKKLNCKKIIKNKIEFNATQSWMYVMCIKMNSNHFASTLFFCTSISTLLNAHFHSRHPYMHNQEQLNGTY